MLHIHHSIHTCAAMCVIQSKTNTVAVAVAVAVAVDGGIAVATAVAINHRRSRSHSRSPNNVERKRHEAAATLHYVNKGVCA